MGKNIKKIAVININTKEESYTTNKEWLNGQSEWIAKDKHGESQVITLINSIKDKMVSLIKLIEDESVREDISTQFVKDVFGIEVVAESDKKESE